MIPISDPQSQHQTEKCQQKNMLFDVTCIYMWATLQAHLYNTDI